MKKTGKKSEKKLSDTHRRFVEEYVKSLNATRAYMAVYPKSSYEAARRSASDLLTNPDIRAAIEKIFDDRVMKKSEVLYRLSDMARATHFHFIEIDEEGSIYFDFSAPEAKDHLHLIKKIHSKRKRLVSGKGESAEAWEHEWIEVELHDAKDALKLIGEHENLFKPEKGDGETFSAPEVIELIKSYEEKRGK